jgi:tetratricopeptide (TPR) repeat protein
LPSELNLAALLASTGDKTGAIEQYRNILTQQPGYIAARLALARLLDPEGAIEQLRIVVQADPQNVAALEQTGDFESARGHAAEARAAYTQAIAAASERGDKKRIAGKLKTLNP